jgi:hypothetical protein
MCARNEKQRKYIRLLTRVFAKKEVLLLADMVGQKQKILLVLQYVKFLHIKV